MPWWGVTLVVWVGLPIAILLAFLGASALSAVFSTRPATPTAAAEESGETDEPVAQADQTG